MNRLSTIGRAVSRPASREASRAVSAVAMAGMVGMLGMLGAGCGEDVEPPCRPFDKCPPPYEEEPYPARTSPLNVLRALERAYPEREFDEYTKLFAPEFVFEFAEIDVQKGTTPASWPLEDELNAARNMFSDETVDRIELEFSTSPVRPAVEGDNLPTIEGIFVVELASVDLIVYTRAEIGGLLSLLVDGHDAEFFFEESDDVDPSSGRRLWRIVRWRDKPPSPGVVSSRPSPALPTEPVSWGRIKHRYH